MNREDQESNSAGAIAKPKDPAATATLARLRCPCVMARLAACLATSLIALAITASVGAARGGHHTSTKCDTRRGHVMDADSQALLYRAPEKFENLIVYGCILGKHRSYRLGDFPEDTCGTSGCIGVQHGVLSGPLVAYDFFSIGEESRTFLVIVRDLRNGRVLHRVPTGLPFPPNKFYVGNGFALAIVLKSDGAVAWVTEYSEGADTEHEVKYYEVHALDKTGNRLLATSTDIDPHSLALAGSTLYWTQGGKPFSTILR